MLKILYAAGKGINSNIQLRRFLSVINSKNYHIKIAAYKQSSFNINVDWTLDCLLSIFNPDNFSIDNDNFGIYFDQVKRFKPDLIISDLEYFTSYIANNLNIPLWQYSSTLINYAVDRTTKVNVDTFKKYSRLIFKDTQNYQRTINIIDNSNYNFVCSHLGEVESPFILDKKFEWIRPYFKIGKISSPCHHNMVARISNNNKHIINLIKNYSDVVIFTDFLDEKYNNISIKNTLNDDEYYCNLSNSNLFICEGQPSFLADAFYNGKFTLIFPNFNDAECVLNSVFSNKLNLSISIYDSINDELENISATTIAPIINKNISFLHSKIDKIYDLR